MVDLPTLFKNKLTDKFGSRESNNIFKLYFEKKKLLFDEKDEEQIIKDLKLLLDDYPIQYLLESAWFYELELYVNDSVLIPRPETEELVHLILQEHQDDKLSVIDIATGSGCIALSLSKRRSYWNIVGTDISPQALEVAQYNAQKNDLEVKWIRHDILSENYEVFDGKFDVLVSNPPYISEVEKHLMGDSVIRFEPDLALFHKDPLIFYRTILSNWDQLMNDNGVAYFELNEFRSKAIQNFSQELGLTSAIIQDLSGKDRILKVSKLSI